MRIVPILIYLALPTFLASYPVGLSIVRADSPIYELLLLGVGGFLFYAGPFLLWMLICRVFNFPRAYWHTGLSVTTLALLLICSAWLFPPDPSGLPMQWVLYLPLAFILQTVLVAIFPLLRKVLPNNRFNSDAGKAGAG